MAENIIKYRITHIDTDRLDKVLVQKLSDLSRSRIQSLIKKGFVTVNGEVETKSSRIIEDQTVIEIVIPEIEPTDIVAENIPLNIIYENSNLLVIDKVAGMVTHPSAGHSSGTLVNAVLGYAPNIKGIGGQERPGIVHRLDKDTSGIILVAKDDITHRFLQDQFRMRKVEKFYLALVDGCPSTDTGRIEASIGRDSSNRKRMAITSKGKGREAISDYKILEKFKEYSLLEFHPLTGRTHQIRLHCRMLGCPIVGDRVYGKKNSSIQLNRHFLHAWKLSIDLPGGEKRTFIAELPDTLKNALNNLRK